MLSTVATRKMIQENINEYLDMMERGEEIIMTDNNHKELGRFVPHGKVVTLIGERVRGILSKNLNADKIREEEIKKKYEIAD